MNRDAWIIEELQNWDDIEPRKITSYKGKWYKWNNLVVTQPPKRVVRDLSEWM